MTLALYWIWQKLRAAGRWCRRNWRWLLFPLPLIGLLFLPRKKLPLPLPENRRAEDERQLAAEEKRAGAEELLRIHEERLGEQAKKQQEEADAHKEESLEKLVRWFDDKIE